MSFIASARTAAYRTFCDTEGKSATSLRFESFITWLIIANLFALVLERIPAFYDGYEDSYDLFDRLSIYIFTAEYALRLFAASGDPRFAGKRFATLRHALTPFALIDALVIFPYWLQMLGLINLDLRALRALRLLRLLKLLRDFIPAVRAFWRANAGRTPRQKVYALMNDTPTSGRLHEQIDFIFILFIVTSVIAVFLETVPSIYEPLKDEFHYFDLLTIFVFTTEYLLRLYAVPEGSVENSETRDSRWAWMKRPNSLIDLIAILPFYLQFFITLDLRFIRVLRVLRILKLTRYNTALSTFASVMKRERSAFMTAMFIVVLITILSAAIVFTVEHQAQPEKFDTMVRALYWAVITLASVGYGDISPITHIGQAFTMVLSLLGIGIVALPAGILGSAFSDQLHQQREQMIHDIEAALEDGVLSAKEEEKLELERVRLHISEKQFELMKSRAMFRHAAEFSIKKVVHSAATDISRLREILKSMPADEVFAEISKLNLPESEQAALRVLIK
jgi:voltage-gated potassium channel